MFRRREKPKWGWRMEEQTNEFTGAVRYWVRYVPYPHPYSPPQEKYGPFDTSEEALTVFHEKSGWRRTGLVQ